MKECDEPGCNYPVFSKKKCKSHWLQIYGKPIPKTTTKRQEQTSEYQTRRRAFISKLRAEGKGKLWCPFCSERIFGDPDIHHTMGRDDETLLDEKYWHIGHNKCHVHMYHSMSCNDIPWWKGYMIWLKTNMPPEVYLKELNRQNKANEGTIKSV